MTSETVQFRVVVSDQKAVNAVRLVKSSHQLGIPHLEGITVGRLYFISGAVTEEQVSQLAKSILADPVTEKFSVTTVADGAISAESGSNRIEICLHPGVTDPAGENLVRVAHDLGIEVEQAATGQWFEVTGVSDSAELTQLATQLLSNPVIQHYAINRPITPPFVPVQSEDPTTTLVPLTAATNEQLLAISRERRLSLDLAEMQAIQAYYQTEAREPNDVELETLAQTWSEHCVHKTFRATIDYTGPDGTQETIHGLLKTYIRAATDKINKPWVRSTFVDNAGIVRFDDHYDLAFKVETHNHPSALEPFGGANTGIGGVIRDILGVSARPIANTDILCFGQPDLPISELPAGVLHPSRIADGVIHGIEDYGNKMGIPTVNGAIVYHDGYTANPLVYCGCVGILPHGSHRTGTQPGDLIVSIGGRVGRDGLRGATFSSMEMDQSTSSIAGSSVQIGHPIMEKQVQEVVLKCRDEGLYSAITDCGAGGFSSAVGEMAQHVGAHVQLKNALLKYPGLQPWEIWLSEAQERIILAVPPDKWERVQEIAASQDVPILSLGTFAPTGRLELFYGETLVGSLSMEFLHDGIPTRHLSAEWSQPIPTGEPARELLSADTALLQLLAHPNIRSKEDVVRLYDHEVQTGTAVKPFVGVADHAPSDAAVIVPLDTISAESTGPVRGFALSNGICPTYGELDPYAMAWAAVDEAIRNAVAVGANPDEISILDNFCWGNPLLSDRLGALVRCTQGCHDAAVAYRTPFISGKDSLNNEYWGADGKKHAIPGTILISALAIVPDVNHTVTMDWKRAGNALYIVGDTRAEMGGSHYALLHGEKGGTPPQPLTEGLARYRSLHRAIQQGLVASCHDLSEGGLGVALAEMALGGRLGAEISLKQMPANVAHDAILLFSESIGRFVVEVAPENEQAFNFNLTAEPHARIGTISAEQRLIINGYHGDLLLDLPIEALEIAWRGAVKPTLNETIQTHAAPVAPVLLQHRPKVMILHANGTNRDRDAALACELAGGDPEIVHLNQLLQGQRHLSNYQMLVVAGGFSYGDDLGAGVLFSAEFQHNLNEQLQQFVAQGRPTLGICNGFQVLVKANLFDHFTDPRPITLTYNEQGHFECRWVYLEPNQASPSIFTKGLSEPIHCPIAHGEGRFCVSDASIAQTLQAENLIALSYIRPNGESYPFNPNGSVLDIAGITNRAGNVLGLMPHPENHILAWQNPRRHRGQKGLDGLQLFRNGLAHA